jgi:2-C-methyl-D-erythritol 4-phosphate cytidylyltransferase
MLEGQRIAGLLLMGGSGRRFGSNLPKQFHRLAGKSVYIHTLEAFLQADIFDEIILSCHRDWIKTIEKNLPAAVRVIVGGATRQESSYKGLLALCSQPAAVVIHDAVRPFVTKEILLQNASMALLHGAVDTCIPSADTLVHAPDRHSILAIPPRADFLRGQTPQSFSYPLILEAHRNTQRKDASDDCQLVLEAGHRVSIVRGSESNLKITSELDLLLAEHLLRLKKQEARAISSTSLKGRRYALVGGTGGIGRAIMSKLISMGAETIPLSRKTEPPLDLSDPASIAKAFSWINKHGGPLDGLINCAGKLLAKPLEDLSAGEIDEMLSINLKGLILSCQLAPLKKGAHVINIASSSYSRGRKETCVYSSAKAGVVNFTQGWAEERPDLSIHAVIPQRTDTPMRRVNFPGEDRTSLLDPDTVAEAVISLLQETDSTGSLVEVKKASPLMTPSLSR